MTGGSNGGERSVSEHFTVRLEHTEGKVWLQLLGFKTTNKRSQYLSICKLVPPLFSFWFLTELE